MENETPKSIFEAARSLERPPEDRAVTQDNVFGGTGEQEDQAAAPEDQEAQKTEGSAPEEDEKQTGRKRKSSRDRRINRLIRHKTQAEERAAALEKELEDLRSENASLRVRGVSKKPLRDDFDSDEDYAEAYADRKKSDTPPPRQAKKTSQSQKRGAFERELKAFLDDGQRAVGRREWDRVESATRAGNLVVNELTLEYIMDSDHGHAMLVELAKDRSLALEIFNERGHGALELLQDLEIRMDPESRPEAKDPEKSDDRDGKGRFKKQKPPPGPKQLRGGPSEATKSLEDLMPQGEDLKTADLEATMRARREYHNRRAGRI